MKHLKTILREGTKASNEYELYADAERTGEISRKTYYRACEAVGMSERAATESLRENYQRAGIAHLF